MNCINHIISLGSMLVYCSFVILLVLATGSACFLFIVVVGVCMRVFFYAMCKRATTRERNTMLMSVVQARYCLPARILVSRLSVCVARICF